MCERKWLKTADKMILLVITVCCVRKMSNKISGVLNRASKSWTPFHLFFSLFLIQILACCAKITNLQAISHANSMCINHGPVHMYALSKVQGIILMWMITYSGAVTLSFNI